DALFLVRNHHALALGAHQHLVFRQLEVAHSDELLVVTRGIESSFINKVCEIRTGESRCTSRNHGDVNVFTQRNLARVNFQDAFASTDVRSRNHNASVETPWPEQRRIENVRTVRRSNQDHTVVRLKAIHLDQQLVQRLFAFVVSTTEACATMTAHRIDLVDEDDARRILLALLKQVAYTRCTDADEHLNEVGTGDREERNVCFTSDRTGQQSLTCSRRSHHQNTLRNASAEFLKLLRFLEE